MVTKKTCLELPADLYFYLQEKALELRKKQASGEYKAKGRISIVSLIRELVRKDKEKEFAKMKR